jgi:hypothetical protein
MTEGIIRKREIEPNGVEIASSTVPTPRLLEERSRVEYFVLALHIA